MVRNASEPTPPRARRVPGGLELQPAKEPPRPFCIDGTTPDPRQRRLVRRAWAATPAPQAREWLLVPGRSIPLRADRNLAALRPGEGNTLRPGDCLLLPIGEGRLEPRRKPGLVDRRTEIVGPLPAHGGTQRLRPPVPAKPKAPATLAELLAAKRRGPAAPPAVAEGLLDGPLTKRLGADAYRLRYRTTELELQAEFVDEYLPQKAELQQLQIRFPEYADTLEPWGGPEWIVSSPRSTLFALWGNFLADFATAASDFEEGLGVDAARDLFEARIGCWAIETEGEEFLSQYGFFPYDKGAPRHFVKWLLAFTFTYAGYTRYNNAKNWFPDVAGVEEDPEVESFRTGVEDFDGWIQRQLMGNDAESRQKSQACFLEFNVRWYPPLDELLGRLTDFMRWGRENETPACEVTQRDGDQFTSTQNCLGLVPPNGVVCHNLAWDDWTPKWGEADNIWKIAGEGDGDPPANNCPFNAYHNAGTVNFHPSDIAWDAWVFDQILDLARMAHDYGRWLSDRGEDPTAAVTAADQFGRYALAMLMYRGEHLVHELGHAYFANSAATYRWPGDHCLYNCGNDIAQHAFTCGVRGRLGLPEGWYVGSYGVANDFDPAVNTDITVEGDPCSGDVWATTTYRCRLSENGVPGALQGFCSSGCIIDLPWFFGYAVPGVETDGTLQNPTLAQGVEAMAPATEAEVSPCSGYRWP